MNSNPTQEIASSPADIDGFDSLAQQKAEGRYQLFLSIDGLYCALCIQKVEQAVRSHECVEEVRLNFSTGRLSILWRGEASLANQFAKDIVDLGYQVRPYNPDQDQLRDEGENRFLLICLGVAGFAMGNIMLLSVGLWSSDGATMGEATRTFLHWISAVIALPAVLFAGRPFFYSALSVLKKGTSNMDVPISLALILACGMSLIETIQHGEHVYFDSALMLTFFLLVGRYLDFRARRNAKGAAHDLLARLSGFATIITPDGFKKIHIQDLKPAMQVHVAMGEKIPADGRIIQGQSDIDTSLITGETLPKRAQEGDYIYAGTVNLGGVLTLQVEKAAQNSLLSDIVSLMERAEQGQARYVRLADRAAKLYTPVIHSLALLAFLFWWGYMGLAWQEALMIAVTVLIITCPCALGLAVPIVQLLATGRLMAKRILLKTSDALEKLAHIDMAIFDKTGSLTLGKPVLKGGHYDADSLNLAASLAASSAHPYSKAIAKAAGQDTIQARSDVREVAGQGLQAGSVYLGQPNWLKDKITDDPHDLSAYKITPQQSALWLVEAGVLRALFLLEDPLKQEAGAMIKAFQEAGIHTVLLSGDAQALVVDVAGKLGIKEAYGGQNPVEKHSFLKAQQQKGHRVLMFGDGLNDAAILSQADIAMAPGTAIDLAQNAADMIIMRDDLNALNKAYQIAKAANRLVRQNFMLAILYNIAAVPLAFAGMVTPMIAALAMSGSSLLVIANSYRLKLFP